MGLGCKESNAGVQLARNIEVLVVSWQVSNEGRVMGSYLRDVGIFPGAQRIIPIASCADITRTDQEEPEKYFEKHIVDLDSFPEAVRVKEQENRIRSNILMRGIYGKPENQLLYSLRGRLPIHAAALAASPCGMRPGHLRL